MSDDSPAEANGTPADAAETQSQPRLQILAQFVRDLSFENAVAQRGTAGGEVTPEIAVQVSLDARRRGEIQYEVISKFKVNSTNSADGAALFICEVEYGGIFQIEGIPDDQMHAFLMIECPRLLFPFVRRIISDVTRDGGFPPFNMDLVDFVALYRQELARRAQAERPASQALS